jgi:hypothetical protein
MRLSPVLIAAAGAIVILSQTLAAEAHSGDSGSFRCRALRGGSAG